MLDTKEERIQEWPLPTKFTQPYDVIWDKNGDLWTGGMTTDRVIASIPRAARRWNIRCRAIPTCAACSSTFSTTPPTFWVGSNHGASIVRVEPLD